MVLLIGCFLWPKLADIKGCLCNSYLENLVRKLTLAACDGSFYALVQASHRSSTCCNLAFGQL